MAHPIKAAAAKPAMLELLSVRVNDQDFAINIMSVREIRGWTASTPLSQAPDFVKGVINLRGVVMPIISLAQRLKLASGEPGRSSVVVVVEDRDRIVGVIVDAVSDILNVTEDLIQPVPEVGAGAMGKAVRGLIVMDGSIVSVLSIPDLMPETTAAAAEQTLAA